MTRTALTTIVLLSALALTGCDDVLLFDVAADGRILAPIDRAGHVTGLGDGATARHLVVVDPTTGEVERYSREPQVMTWPHWCGEAVVLVEARSRLVLLQRDGSRRVLYESDRRLLQPTPSPAGDRVAVLEVERPGLPGLLHVIDVETGRPAGVPLDGVLVGFAWSGDALVVPRLGGADLAEARPFEGGQGEVLLARGDERRLLFRGRLPGVTWLAPVPGGEDVVGLLARGDDPAGLTLAGLSLARPGATAAEAVDGLDLWPTVDAAGRTLFTRSRPGRPSLEGELRLTRAGALGASTRIPTPGPVCAPRWTGERVAYLTPDDHLVTQDLDGGGLVDWTDRLAALSGDLP